MEALTYFLMILIGLLIGMATTMLISMREWIYLDSKIGKLRKEKQELYNTVQILQAEQFTSRVTFEED